MLYIYFDVCGRAISPKPTCCLMRKYDEIVKFGPKKTLMVQSKQCIQETYNIKYNHCNNNYNTLQV